MYLPTRLVEALQVADEFREKVSQKSAHIRHELVAGNFYLLASGYLLVACHYKAEGRGTAMAKRSVLVCCSKMGVAKAIA